jgi:hypothetical protein
MLAASDFFVTMAAQSKREAECRFTIIFAVAAVLSPKLSRWPRPTCGKNARPAAGKRHARF